MSRGVSEETPELRSFSTGLLCEANKKIVGSIFLEVVHAIAMHHINTVRSWGIPQSMPIVELVVEVEPVVEPSPEAVEEVVEVEPVIELVIESISVKRALQSVGAAAMDIQKMSVRELREYCLTNTIHSSN